MAIETGKINTTAYNNAADSEIPINEGICALMFEISGKYDVFGGYSLANNNFGNEKIQCIYNVVEAEQLGIQQYGLMAGIPYYHIKQYYDYIGKDWPLYVCFADGLNDSSEIFERLMIESNSSIFQIGIWTDTLGINKTADKLTVSNIFQKYQSKAMVLNGSEETPSAYPSGVNVIVSAPMSNPMPSSDIDYRKLPDITDLGYHKVSFLLGQDNDLETEKIYSVIGGEIHVGMIGLTLACLTLAYAEENIACVGKFDLNKDDTLSDMCLVTGKSKVRISDMNQVQVSRLAAKGYIFPMIYEAKPGGVYLSSDSTMSDGDYNTISANRVIHKLRRVARRVLTPMINGRIMFNKDMAYLSDATITEITNNLNSAIDAYMVNPEGQEQIGGYMPVISNYQKNLKDDQLAIGFKLIMLESEEVINFVEKYNI